MNPVIINLRLQQLETKITTIFNLINEFETELLDESEPDKISRYNRRVKKLKEMLIDYQEEYDDLNKKKIDNDEISEKMEDVGIKLEQVNDNLISLEEKILGSYADLQNSLISYYLENEQRIISDLTQKLNHNQLVTVQIILKALDNNKINGKEIEDFVNTTQKILLKLKEKQLALPPNEDEVIQVINNPNIDTQHKLKVCLPIIPFILEYETELGLSSGIDLKALWNKWRKNS